MPLNATVIEQLLAHTKAKWKNHSCPLCFVNNWSVEGVAVPLADGSRMWVDRSLPSAALVCLNCGNTVLVNLYVAGVDVAAIK